MHRHGYRGRKFHRETDQRKALMKSLATSLIEHGSIETTEPKAKELRPYVEKLITKAKKGGLHNRRQVARKLHTVESAHLLFDQIAPRVKRESGYLRIERTHHRRGDNAQMAIIEFVDEVYVPEADSGAPAADMENKPVEPNAKQEGASAKKVKAEAKK